MKPVSREQAVKDTVRGIREGDVRCTPGTEIGDGAEHADCPKQVVPTSTTCVVGDLAEGELRYEM